MDRCLVLFVEGETEVEFYRRIISEAKKLRPNKQFDLEIETKCVKGVGNFKTDVLRKFKKEIITNHADVKEFIIVLCSDTDVFEFTQHPPIIWKDVIAELRNAGANEVIHIQAKHSIEDWFLYDLEGIISFLRLPKKTKVPSSGNGYQKLNKLYGMAHKMYFKGMKSNGMIQKLDFEKIIGNISQEMKPLYKVLGINK